MHIPPSSDLERSLWLSGAVQALIDGWDERAGSVVSLKCFRGRCWVLRNYLGACLLDLPEVDLHPLFLADVAEGGFPFGDYIPSGNSLKTHPTLSLPPCLKYVIWSLTVNVSSAVKFKSEFHLLSIHSFVCLVRSWRILENLVLHKFWLRSGRRQEKQHRRWDIEQRQSGCLGPLYRLQANPSSIVLAWNFLGFNMRTASETLWRGAKLHGRNCRSIPDNFAQFMLLPIAIFIASALFDTGSSVLYIRSEDGQGRVSERTIGLRK